MEEKKTVEIEIIYELNDFLQISFGKLSKKCGLLFLLLWC